MTALIDPSLKQRLDSFLVTGLLATMPIAMLTDLGQASTVFYILAAICLSICFSRPGGVRATLGDLKDYKPLAMALFFSLAVIAVAAMRSDKRLDNEIERALRISVGTFVVLGAYLSLIPQWLRQATWGMVIVSWVATGYAAWFSWPSFRRPLEVPQYNAVSYGDLLLMMTTLATFSIGWRLTRFRKTEIAFKVVTLLVGLIGFITTQTRGGWLAVPFFIVIGLAVWGGKLRFRKLILPAILAILLATAAFASSSIMRQRFQDAFTKTVECVQNPLAISSECGRIQLAHAAWLMFKADPFFGNGATNRFGPQLENYWSQGIISDFTHSQEFDEPHNDMLFSMASHGVFGLIALLLIFAAPSWIFIRRLGAQVAQPARVAAAMGLVLCVGFFVFGWTELILRGIRTLGFYAVAMAWLLALSDERFLTREG